MPPESTVLWNRVIATVVRFHQLRDAVQLERIAQIRLVFAVMSPSLPLMACAGTVA